MTTHPIARGALAGLAATVPMTAAMAMMHRALPPEERYPLPPRLITEQVAEKTGLDETAVLEKESDYKKATAVSHFAYGALAGAIYGPVAHTMPGGPVAGGVVFGIGLWAVSYLGLLPAVNILSSATRHPARRNALMIAAHIVWGAALGALTEASRSRLRES